MSSVFSYQSFLFFFDLLSFSFLLLPCYYALRSPRARRVLMIFAGLYLVYFIAPRLALLYLGFWSLVYFTHRFAFLEEGETGAGKKPAAGRKYLALLGLVGLPLLVLPLIFWKTMENNFIAFYTMAANNALHLVSSRLWQIDLCKPLMAPIGLSFSTFRAVDLLVKTSLGKITGLTYDEVLFYGFFPPVQVVGPIIEYEEIADQSARADPAEFLEGLLRIGTGFFKAFALSTLLEDNAVIFEKPGGFHAWQLWLRLIGYSWYFYLNFSGYSDMAIGAARLFGFRLKENFNFPYFKPNIQEFWNSWHMSLSRWAQRNVFVPFGGYREKTQYFALFMTMLAIAMWHSVSFSMVVFAGVQFGALVLHRRRNHQLAASGPAPHRAALPFSGAEKISRVTRLQTAGYILLTYLTILLCLPLIFLSFTKALGFYAALFGVGR